MTDTMTDERALELVRWLTNGSDATPPPPDVTLQQAYNHIASRLSALQAQQPGAQAVAFRFRHEGPWSRWLEMNELHHYDRNGSLVNGPAPAWEVEYANLAQPPSIPEPSEEDAKAVLHALIVCRGTYENEIPIDAEDMRAALTTYTARLRERIGGGAQ